MSKIERLHSAVQIGPVSRVALARTSNFTTPLLEGEGAVIVATTSQTGELTLSTWKLDLGTGRLTQASTTPAGHAASRHAITDSLLPVVALREVSSGKLRVIAFGDPDHAGSHAVHSATSGAVKDDSLTVCSDLSKGGCVVAFADGAGVLKVEHWAFVRGEGVKRIASSGDQGVGARLITVAFGYGFFVTAFRDSNEDLRLMMWSIFTPDEVRRVGSSEPHAAGFAAEIAITTLPLVSPPEMPFLGPIVITAVSDSQGHLRVISWNLDLSLKEGITRLSTHRGRAISEVAVTAFEKATHENSGLFVVAVRDDSGHLKLISFRVHPNGHIDFLADSAGEPTAPAPRIAIVGMSSDIIVTASKDSDSKLRLVSWRVTPS